MTAKMTDRNGKEIKRNDILRQVVGDGRLKSGTLWKVIDFGIEYSTKAQVSIIKSIEKNYIMSTYQSELIYFEKVSDNER